MPLYSRRAWTSLRACPHAPTRDRDYDDYTNHPIYTLDGTQLVHVVVHLSSGYIDGL